MDRARSSLSAVPKQWKTPKALRILFALELPLSIAALALFGIAQPNLYRTKFWQEGSDHGWNSNPNQLVYAAANYRPISAPLPWSQFTTNFNVVIAILSVFILLCKIIMTVCGVFHPLLSLFAHSGLVAIWAVSIHNQAGPDMSDPAHPQPGAPWYITRSCGPPVKPSLIGYCKQAKAAFAVTIIMTTLFFTYVLLTLWTLLPSKSFRAARRSKLSDQEARSQPWEMLEAPRMPGTPSGLKSPTTPRTRAFNTLTSKSSQPKATPVVNTGKAPERRGNVGITLKHHVAMDDDEAYQGPSAR